MSFKAQIIADSKNEFGNRITTFVLTFPRIILAEFNTHRMLSKNSASSRAIPFEKMVKAVQENPFIPIAWMKDHKGMQGSEYFGERDSLHLKTNWLEARDYALTKAKAMAYTLNPTKQLLNRLLEPFMYHTVICTGTEWQNFFALRAHKDAEIHMQKLAYMMLDEYNKSEPKQLKAGEWHIPYEDKINDIGNYLADKNISKYQYSDINSAYYNVDKKIYDLIKVKISIAMCARTSYTLVGEEGKESNYENDIKLHDRLLQSGHMSPFEHCARAMSEYEFEGGVCDTKYIGGDEFGNPLYQGGWCGNYMGFIQYRKTIEGENQKDERVIKK